MADIDQKRRTVRVLELMDASFRAHQRGDRAAFEAAVNEALETDAAVVSVVRGGMVIGEIPRPEEHPYEWDEYLRANREGLAAMEAEAAGDE